MRRRPIILIFALSLVFAALFVLLSATKVPALRVLVVDDSGTPVPGAKIKPDGIRGTDGAHYGWGDHFSVKPAPLTTDANGRATIPYPRFIMERVRSIELSFGVDHPDYSPDRRFVPVASPLRSSTPFLQRLQFIYDDFQQSRKIERIVLKRAAALELSALIEGRPIPATNLHAQLVPAQGVFNGLFLRAGHRLSSKQVPAGNYILRAFSRLDGTNYFSDLLTLNGVPGATNIATPELKPGHDLEGRLTGIDGPVANGWVNLRVVHAVNANGTEPMLWADFAEVRPDGTFRLSGLPAGRLECVALCDGYLSENPVTNYSSQVLPHKFEIPANSPVLIPMKKSATATVRVLGPDGQPVAGASVHFWPNVQWAGWLSTIFASDFYRDADALQRIDLPLWQAQIWTARRDFTAKTDPDGRATIRELPPETLPFSVDHPTLELPLETGRRNASIRLIAGETNHTSVKLDPKGKHLRD
jgi:hypothetical protein